MVKWQDSAAICMNAENRLLMVLQGTKEEEKTWAVPSGGKEAMENFQSCCIREVYEETGYTVTIIKEIYRKNNADGEVLYFEAVVMGGQLTIHDPDELIYDIVWQSKDDVARLPLTFPEDRPFLLSLFP